MTFRWISVLVAGAILGSTLPLASQAPPYVPADIERAIDEALSLVETTPDAGGQHWRLYVLARTLRLIRGPAAVPDIRRLATRQRQAAEDALDGRDSGRVAQDYRRVLAQLAEVEPEAALSLWDQRLKPSGEMSVFDDRMDPQFRADVLQIIARRTPERIIPFYRESGEAVANNVILRGIRSALAKEKERLAQDLVEAAYQYYAGVAADHQSMNQLSLLLRSMPKLTPDRRFEGLELLVARLKEWDRGLIFTMKNGDAEVQLNTVERYTIELSDVLPDVVRLVPTLEAHIAELGGTVSIPPANAPEQQEAQVVSPGLKAARERVSRLLPRLKAGPESLKQAAAEMSTNHDDIRLMMRTSYNESMELLDEVQQASLEAIDEFEEPVQRLVLTALWLTDGPSPMSADVLEHWTMEADQVEFDGRGMPGMSARQWLQVRLLERWSREDPMAALEWVFDHPSEGRLQYRSLIEPLKVWAARNAKN